MQYQVVARVRLPSAGNWEYYPYLAPGRDKATAERLARHAAHCGYEAAILQSVTLEMLTHIARGVVDQQDERLVPKLRYMPNGTPEAGALQKYGVVPASSTRDVSNPYAEEPDKAAMDARRSAIEMGPGGDVAACGPWSLSFPLRMDVVRSWLRLRERVVLGQIGGNADGAGKGAADDVNMLTDETG